MKKVYSLAIGLAVLGCAVTSTPGHADDHRPEKHRHRAKNIIFMVPDGMGLADVTASRIFLNGPDGEPLAFEKMPVIGYQRTHSANSTVTDSAAAASAWSTGDKFNNGEIACHSDGAICLENPTTILEEAAARGKATGLVVTSSLTHATPAAFGAHVHSRKCETEIGRQYVEETRVDVLLGGGIGANRSGYNCEQYPGQDKDAVVTSAIAGGYTYVQTLGELNGALQDDAGKILGLFAPYGKTPENFHVDPTLAYPQEEPTLAVMTEAALDVLEENNRGFFLMVEGSLVDWADHGNRLGVQYDENGDQATDKYGVPQNSQIAEMIAFNKAVETVRSWINDKKGRAEETLVVVVADHETGGFAITGPYGTLSQQGEVVEDGWISHHHTAVDTLIWAQGPGSAAFGRALDNTDLNSLMKKVMR